MRFSSLIAFILPLSALATPIIVVDRVAALRNLFDGLKNASRIYGATLSLPLENEKMRQSIASLQANIAVIPLAGAMDNISKAVHEGRNPGGDEYVNIAYWSK